MAELVQMLTDAPKEIREDGMSIVKEETQAAAMEIGMAYSRHSRTGRLARQVTTEFPSTTILYGQVLSRAPHSHLFEFGTRKRHTDRGWNRGAVPEADPQVTVPIAQRRRERMMRRLADVLRQRGFEVSE